MRAAGVAGSAVAVAAVRGRARPCEPDPDGASPHQGRAAQLAPAQAGAPPVQSIEPAPQALPESGRLRGAYLPANGRPPFVVRRADGCEPASVRLYVHPGRVLIAEMSAERVAAQLDMARALLFETLAAAELAADEGAGFLVEIREPFLDAHGKLRSAGCYFLGRLV